MSLLQDENFLIWHLRSSYLTHVRDGVGERLINFDAPALVNNPIIKAAGLGSIPDVYRPYSPPIPVATSVAEEYFVRPDKDAGLDNAGLDDDDDEGGVVIRPGSRGTLGPSRQTRRRRRRNHQQEDDSSELSDESDEDVESTLRFVNLCARDEP